MESFVHTQVSLHDIGRVLEGSLANPSEVLGRHEVSVDGKLAISVRAFLPEAAQVWLLEGNEFFISAAHEKDPSFWFLRRPAPH